MSLRARLLAGMVALVAAGLAVAAFVTYEEQRSFLLKRVDQQVLSAVVPFSAALRFEQPQFGPFPRRPPPPGFGSARPNGQRRSTFLPPGTFGELLGSDRHVLRRRTFSYGGN